MPKTYETIGHDEVWDEYRVWPQLYIYFPSTAAPAIVLAILTKENQHVKTLVLINLF